MTTLRELGEMLIEVGENGRKMQFKRHNVADPWCSVYYTTAHFNIAEFEYRLEPKIVKHERWIVLSDHLGCATEEEAMEYGGIVKKITWETEE